MSSSPWASKKAWVDDETMSPKFPLLLPEHFFEISKHLTCAYELGSMLLTCKEWHNGIMIAMSNINPYWIQWDFTGFKEKTTYIETLKNLCQLLFECIPSYKIKNDNWHVKAEYRIRDRTNPVISCYKFSSTTNYIADFIRAGDMKPIGTGCVSNTIMAFLLMHPVVGWSIIENTWEPFGNYTVQREIEISLTAEGKFVPRGYIPPF